MKRRQMGLSILAAVGVAASVGTGLAITGDRSADVPKPVALSVVESGDAPQWLRALTIRSDALNKKHGLGDYWDSTSRDWLPSLMIQSDALNKKYGLGEYSDR